MSGRTVRTAADHWIRRADRGALAHYIATGERGPGQPTDLRPRSERRADVLRIHRRARPARLKKGSAQ